ncbi:MAG: 16S rRNA (guanine(527)-N(7))-methyltransferase RsmG [Thiohalomonadaceae bacterium]
MKLVVEVDKAAQSWKDSLATELAEGVVELGLSLDEKKQEQVLAYLQLLIKWNKTYNLTAIRQPHEMIRKHLLDSLAIWPYLRGEQILDIGSGAGLPGIPLAIADPAREFTLLDSNSKKTRFLLQVKGELQLVNLSVVHSRLEDYRPAGVEFDTITARAFATLAEMLSGAAHLFARQTCLLAMKGEYPGAELAALPEGFVAEEIIALTVPGLAQQRHLVRIVTQG